jgi:hypothetical protein
MPHICAGKVSIVVSAIRLIEKRGDLFLVCSTNTHFVEPSNIWDA